MRHTTESISAHLTAPIVLKFESTKTPNEVYEYLIDSIDKAFGVVMAFGDQELMRQSELRLENLKAQLHNAQANLSGRPLERATFDELLNHRVR